MANIWLPSQSKLAHALREPVLLCPFRKPFGKTTKKQQYRDALVFLFNGEAHEVDRPLFGTVDNATNYLNTAHGFGAVFSTTDYIDLPANVNTYLTDTAVTIAAVWTHDGTTSDSHFFRNRQAGQDGYYLRIISSTTDDIPANSIAFLADSNPDTSIRTSASVNISGYADGEVYAVVCRHDLQNLKINTSTGLSDSTAYSNLVGSSMSAPRIGNAARAWSDAETQNFLADPYKNILEPASQTPVFIQADAAAVGLPAYIGSTQITSVYYGSTEITEIYKGSTKLWP